MKYLFVNASRNNEEVEEFGTREEAISRADAVWYAMWDYDKKNRDAFYVLESVNPDPEAADHFDGTPIKVYQYFWVDMEYREGWFALMDSNDDPVIEATWEEAGIENDDPMYQDKLDKFIESKLGYLPDYEIN